MKTAILAGAAVLAASVPGVARAQGYGDEIVVTGSRISYADPPHVVMTKRADYLITEALVVCDTRDYSQRQDELADTLRNMVREAARDPSIELSVSVADDEDIVVPFDESNISAVIAPYGKPDSSYARVLVKTVLGPDDTFDAAAGRLQDFASGAAKVGRTEILMEGDWNLTLVGVEQYRPQMLALIAEDAEATAVAFGPDYRVEISGLQSTIQWVQSGPLDLSLFINYALQIDNGE